MKYHLAVINNTHDRHTATTMALHDILLSKEKVRKYMRL